MKSPVRLVWVLARVGKQVEHMGHTGGFEMLLPISRIVLPVLRIHLTVTISGFWLWGTAGYLPTQPDSKPTEGN